MDSVPKETFQSMYAGQALWDIGRPQAAFLAVADRITVMRHGRCIATRRASATDPEDIIALITGAAQMRDDARAARSDKPLRREDRLQQMGDMT